MPATHLRGWKSGVGRELVSSRPTPGCEPSRRGFNRWSRNADQVIVLEEGRIVERGTHDTLLAVGGLHADLYNSQVRCQS